MKKHVISVLLMILMILFTGCTRSGREQLQSGVHTSDDIALDPIPSISDIEDAYEPAEENTSESPISSESEPTEEPTTTPPVLTTTPSTTTTPESTTATITTTKSTTTVTTTPKATTTVTTTTEATPTTAEPEVINEPEDASEMAQQFLELLNEERAKVGAPTLVTGPIIQEMAQVRANELPILIGHTRPNGLDYSTVFTDYKYGIPTGYYSTYITGEQYEIYYRGNAGETVGMMSSTHPEVMIEAFRNSPGHWAVLMDPTLGAAGVAVVAAEDQTYGYIYYYEVLLTDRLYE